MIALTLALLLAVPPDSASHPPLPAPGTQVVRAGAIAGLGLMRLSDLYLLIDEWDVESADGFTWLAVPANAPSAYALSPVVMVDGHLIVPGKGRYAASIDLLPVTLSQIDSVEFGAGPLGVSGFPAHGGTIRIHTRPLEPGLQVRAGGLLGNEAGDPGPHFYTRHASANVDKIGPHLSLDTGYRNGGLTLRATGLYQRQFVEDLGIRSAFVEAGDYPEHRMLNAALRVGLETAGSAHEILAGVADLRDYGLRSSGTPFRTGLQVLNAGAAGSLSLRADDLRYHASWRDETVGEEYVRAAGDSHRSRMLSAHLAWSRPAGAGTLGLAARIQQETLSWRGRAEEITARLAAVTGLWRLRRERSERAVSLTAGMTRTYPNVSVRGRGSWRMAKGTALSLEAAASHNVAVENLWLAADDADRLPPSLPYRQADVLSMRASVLSARAGFQTELARGLVFQLAQQVQYSGLRFSPEADPRAGLAAREASGPAALTILRLDYRPDRSTHQSLSYRFTHRPGSRNHDELFLLSAPSHRIRYTVRYRPVDGFSLSAVAAYQSSVTWSALRHPLFAGDEDALYQRDVLLVHGSVQKWFWNRRLRGSIVFRNLLDRENRHQPGGKNLNLGLFIQAELAL